MTEKDNCEEALLYSESTEDELKDLKVYNIGSVFLIHGGAAFLSVNDSIELQNMRKIKGTRLENTRMEV